MHSEIGVTPLAHPLAGHVDPMAPSAWTAAASRSPGRYRHLNNVHLRYARWDLSRAGWVDPRTGTVLCPIKPLDKSANADAQRRKLDPVGRDLSPLPPSGMAPLLLQLLAEHAATGMPPAYLCAPDAPAPGTTDQEPA